LKVVLYCFLYFLAHASKLDDQASVRHGVKLRDCKFEDGTENERWNLNLDESHKFEELNHVDEAPKKSQADRHEDVQTNH